MIRFVPHLVYYETSLIFFLILKVPLKHIPAEYPGSIGDGGILLKITAQDSSVEFVQYPATSAFSFVFYMEIQIHHLFSRIAMLGEFSPTARPRVGLLRLGQRLLSFHDQMAPCSSGGAAVQQPGIPGLTRIYQDCRAHFGDILLVYWRYFLVILVYWRCSIAMEVFLGNQT